MADELVAEEPVDDHARSMMFDAFWEALSPCLKSRIFTSARWVIESSSLQGMGLYLLARKFAPKDGELRFSTTDFVKKTKLAIVSIVGTCGPGASNW